MTMHTLLEEKLQQSQEILNELELDLWLVYVRETSMTRDPALSLICGGIDFTWETVILIDRLGNRRIIVGHFDAANVEELGLFDQVITYHQGIADELRAQLMQLNPGSIAINYSEGDVAADGLTHGLFKKLHGYLAGTPFATRLVSAERLLAKVRGRKTPSEVSLVRQAIVTTEKLFAEVEQHVRPGMTQRQIADYLHNRIDELGLDYAWPKPFNPIVTCGPHSPIGHAAPGDVALQPGHTLHLDLGVRQQEYCSDLQRMWYVLDDGEHEAPADVQRAFSTVRGALEAGMAALQPGNEGWKVDEVAREFVIDNGYDEFMHGFGHLLGRSAHDGATVLAPRWQRYQGVCELPVEIGNIFTLELHVVIPHRGIMSLEEDVLVTEEGPRYLSHPQTELRYIRG